MENKNKMSSINQVFVDSAAWIALINTTDDLHEQAQEVMARLRQNKTFLVTTEFILLEVADALSSINIRQKTYATLKAIRQSQAIKVIPVNQSLFDAGLAIYNQHSDKDWGLTDCISFAVMQQEKITTAFTSDRHFIQAGFIRLMQPN